jgi:aspartyl-tRNA synthetase
MRDFLDEKGFLEIETPILIKSTPEGARDYLVPSRLWPGKFYALPQSPQQLKQLLMVAGVERYFQIAKCFRDEDLRADRQPEFTQLDLEMSFVTQEDVLDLMEELFTSLVEALAPQFKLVKPFPRLSFGECMERFGCDKPDLRFGLELSDISDIALETEFGLFRSTVAEGGLVKGLCAPGCAGYTRRQLEELTEVAKTYGARGLVTMQLGSGDERGPLSALPKEAIRSVAAKYMTEEQISAMGQRMGASAGDLLLIVAGPPNVVNASLSQLRGEMARRLELVDPKLLSMLFIVGFPLLERNPETGGWEPMHHPFTAPVPEDLSLIDTEPAQARSQHYDMVCNGVELASGSIRIHDRDLQQKVFSLLGYSEEETVQRFGHMLEAFEYGPPPHGGIAPGIDRFVMILAGEKTIREVIAFPKTQSAIDLMTDAPSPVSSDQLAELHLHLLD